MFLSEVAQSGATKDKEMHQIPEVGFLRLPQVLAVFPVSKSAWWAGVRRGTYPKPFKLGLRTTAWRAEDIRALIEHGVGKGVA